MKIEYINGDLLKKMILSGAQNLETNKEIVNALNVFPVPDGDTGTNMSLTMQSAAKEVKSAKSDLLEDIANAAANGSLMGARGNSGVILSQLFRGFAKGVKGKKEVNTKDLAEALKSGADTAYKAVMKPIEGTILTVARESAEAALIIANKEKDIVRFLEKVIKYADRSLERTPELLKVLKDAGVVDSGGKGLLYIYLGALGALTGKIPVAEKDELFEQNQMHPIEEMNGNIEFGYCTEFIIRSGNADIHKFRDIIEGYGDSMLVVGNDSVVKVHIHTNHPGKVLEHALELGGLSDIKIDNMRLQHRHEVFNQAEYKEDAKKEPVNNKEETKKYGFITVTMGDGLTKIFKDFNVDYVIEGGQTMNPSTEDFIKAIENINAETIFILPNNSNVLMAANQAKSISDKNIIVIPSKSVPQGLSALLAVNLDAAPEVNEEAMSEAIQHVRTGQVTYAVRDTSYNDIEICEGDILGIGDSEIKSSGKDMKEVSLGLIDEMITEESEIITVFYGADVSEEEAEELLEELTNKYADIDVELYYGGQPLYYYIFSIE
ncbi:Dak phosphatase [Alkaliphilus oremlandii OhILAs]|uniref:Dak phosphatase n=2 Tax=Alkaliphilus oremlandii TaxID=461876 RepID=A8MH97_ALKOO|nr:DAK2 domain-containing protein [Alkaliphilus oremlandii]ABW18984.1 Dak phosphatase [Alkaliphilus oremlandii OhILAs]